MVKANRELLTAACEHHTNLNTFGAVVALMESGLLYGKPNPAAQKIIDIAKSAITMELHLHDKARLRLERE